MDEVKLKIVSMTKRRGKISDIKPLVKKAIEQKKKFIKNSKNDSNPSVVKMVARAEGMVEALESVYDALHGNLVSLKIFAGE